VKNLRTTQCPFCFFTEMKGGGFVGVCPSCGADTSAVIERIRDPKSTRQLNTLESIAYAHLVAMFEETPQ
jgi:hypothetical protein